MSGLVYAARSPARWYMRVAGTLIEVHRLTRPHRERSLVLVGSTVPGESRTWLVEARELIRG